VRMHEDFLFFHDVQRPGLYLCIDRYYDSLVAVPDKDHQPTKRLKRM
jgi:hypothetical protein